MQLETEDGQKHDNELYEKLDNVVGHSSLPQRHPHHCKYLYCNQVYPPPKPPRVTYFPRPTSEPNLMMQVPDKQEAESDQWEACNEKENDGEAEEDVEDYYHRPLPLIIGEEKAQPIAEDVLHLDNKNIDDGVDHHSLPSHSPHMQLATEDGHKLDDVPYENVGDVVGHSSLSRHPHNCKCLHCNQVQPPAKSNRVYFPRPASEPNLTGQMPDKQAAELHQWEACNVKENDGEAEEDVEDDYYRPLPPIIGEEKAQPIAADFLHLDISSPSHSPQHNYKRLDRDRDQDSSTPPLQPSLFPRPTSEPDLEYAFDEPDLYLETHYERDSGSNDSDNYDFDDSVKDNYEKFRKLLNQDTKQEQPDNDGYDIPPDAIDMPTNREKKNLQSLQYESMSSSGSFDEENYDRIDVIKRLYNDLQQQNGDQIVGVGNTDERVDPGKTQEPSYANYPCAEAQVDDTVDKTNMENKNLKSTNTTTVKTIRTDEVFV